MKLDRTLQLIALIFAALTFGTAYYLLFLAYPAWVSVNYDAFLEVFQFAILRIGSSQIIVSNIALVAGVVLYFRTRDAWWLVGAALLLVSLPVTFFFLMPINLAFIEATDPDLAERAPDMLRTWGRYQVIRLIGDGLAFVAMCKPVIWPKSIKAA